MPTLIVHLPPFSRCKFPIPFSRAIRFSFLFDFGNCIISIIGTYLLTYTNCTLQHQIFHTLSAHDLLTGKSSHYNAVGYGPSALQEAGIVASASFVPVSGTMIDLTDFVGKGYEEETGGEGYSDRDISVQTLNEAGQTQATYQWMDSGEGPDGEWYGWYPEGSEEKVLKGEVQVQPGEGLWVYSVIGGLSIQTSGEVPTASDVCVTLQEAGLCVANPTPVLVDLTKCYITGYEDEAGGEGYCDREVSVQTLNEAGQTMATYQWMDSGDGEWYGWYPEGSEEAIKEGVVPVNPGQGLWTYSTSDGYYFNWPKVDVK